MAIGTTAAIIGGIGLAASAAQTIKGVSDTKKAKNSLNKYNRQELKNSFEDMPVSTAGSDLMREESARTANTLTNTVARGGSRAITANIGRINAGNSDTNRRAALDLDQQYQDRNRKIAQENSRIQDMYERREEADLAGLGAQLQAGRETTWNGMSAMQSSVNYAALNGAFGDGGGGKSTGGKFKNGGYGASLGASTNYSNSQIS